MSSSLSSTDQNRILAILAAAVGLQMMTLGMNFSTLNSFGESLGAEKWMLGLLWTAFSLPRAVCAPLWAAFSDRRGRRPVMMIGGMGTVLGSVLWHSSINYWTLMASRMVDSVLSAQAAVAFAIIADISEPNKRASRLGAIGAIVGLSVIVGPPLGAIIAHRWNFQTVGVAMALLQGLSFMLVALTLPETRKPDTSGAKPEEVLSAAAWRRVFGIPGAANLLGVTLIYTIGYTHLFTALQFCAEKWYGWEEKKVSYAFALYGFTSALSQGGLLRRLLPRYGERPLAIAGIAMMAAAFAVMAAHPMVIVFWFCVGAMGIGLGLAQPSLVGMLSRCTPDTDQGRMAGLSQTVQIIGRSLGPPVGAVLFTSIGGGAPFIGSAVWLATATVMLAASRVHKTA